MNNMINRDLKIEFRAVPYSSSHVLEYRFSPDQDLHYYKEHKWLWGLIKFRTPHKYSTSWKQPVRFRNAISSYRYPENDLWNTDFPIFIHSEDELNKFKQKFKTYGEFLDWYWEEDAKERQEYREARAEYLKKKQIWY